MGAITGGLDLARSVFSVCEVDGMGPPLPGLWLAAALDGCVVRDAV
jgi:hypothetical protein